MKLRPRDFKNNVPPETSNMFGEHNPQQITNNTKRTQIKI